jgi:hypothetical protein
METLRPVIRDFPFFTNENNAICMPIRFPFPPHGMTRWKGAKCISLVNMSSQSGYTCGPGQA